MIDLTDYPDQNEVFGLAEQVLAIKARLAVLERENARLREVEVSYINLLSSSIQHNEAMQFHMLQIALTPSGMKAIE